MSTALFLDTNNLYHQSKHKFGKGRKINYAALLERLESFGVAARREAFGVQINRQSQPFISYLRFRDFETFYYNMDIEDTSKIRQPRINMPMRMAIHILKYAIHNPTELETVIIGSSDPTFKYLIELCQEMNIKVIVVGVNIPDDLKEVANEAIELDESYLEVPNNAAEAA